jgi:hypothetical protein
MKWLCLLIVVALTTPASAASHKILVLPVDGNADAATRSRLNADIARLARGLDGQVSTGNATFADTALAVGCDPHAAGCSDEVIATLGVDELIWGTATRDGRQTQLVVRRAPRGGTVRDVTTTIAAGDSTDRISSGIAPLFAPPTPAPEPARASTAPPRPTDTPLPSPTSPPTSTAPTVSGDTAPVGGASPSSSPLPSPSPSAPAGPAETRSDRTAGIAMVAGGGLSFLLGLALWSSYSSMQDSIDRHPTASFSDIQDLKSLEDSAGNRAIAGDVFVLAGLAVAGVGGYYLYRDHKRHTVAITPAPIPHGGGLTITVLGGL